LRPVLRHETDNKELIMKNQLCLIALLAGVSAARADIVFSDGFTYPDGNLVGAPGSPWSTHSGSGAVVVQSGQIELSRSREEDVNALLTGGPYASTGPVTALYTGFTARFTALPSNLGSYFAHLNTSGARARIWAATTNAAPGSFRLGVGNSTGATATTGQVETDLSLNTDYTVVVRYELATGQSTIWVNPSAETDPGVTAADSVGTSLPGISTFAFRQTGGIGIMLIDNLVIGTTFADVVGGNLPPTISAIANQSIPANGSTGPIPFAVGDDQTPADQLTPTGASDNPALVPDENITFAGSGGNRTVTVTPVAGQQGQANITVSVNDVTATSSTSFLLRVGAPSIDPIANQISPVNTVFGPLAFMVADAEEGAGALTVSATSSNPLLLPNGNIFFGGSGATRTLTATPATGQTGLTTITVTVDDGILTASQSFALTVHPVLGPLAGDDFNRPDDYLVDWVKWIGHSGPPDELFITNNRLPLSQQLAGDANMPLTPGTVYPANGGHVFFASFIANFSELPTGTGTYFAHFAHFGGVPPNFRGRVFATTVGAMAGGLRLGITSNSGTVAANSVHPLELELNTDYLVVIRLNAATGESRLWVNPSVEAAGFVDSTDLAVPSAVEAFAFRQSGPNNGMGVLTVDDLKTGTAFLDVVSNLPVSLSYTLNNTTIRLSWPAGQGYLLRRATSLPAGPANWTNVPFVNEGANDVTNLDISAGNGFFRLEKTN
jgi:hypothetical protein